MDYYHSMHFSSRFAVAALLVVSFTANAEQAKNSGALTVQSAPPSRNSGIAPEDRAAELDAELFYEIFLGELTVRSGDPGAGYSLMLEAARTSGDEALFKRAADIALQARSGESALAAARAWEASLPKSQEAQRYLLQILLALNRTEETGPVLRRLVENAPSVSRKQLVLTLPLLYRNVSDKALALKLVSGALEPVQSEPALASAVAISMARIQLLAAQPALALVSAQRAAGLEPDSDDVALLALDLMEAKAAGADDFAQVAFAGVRPPQLRMGFAKILLERQRYAEAQQQLENVTTLHPEFSQAWLALAALQFQNGQTDLAEISLAKYEEKSRNTAGSDEQRTATAQIYMLRSEIAEKQGDLAKAQQLLSRIEDGGVRFNVQARRAVLFAKDGNLLRARALVQSLPETSPEEAARKQLLDIQVLREAGSFTEAYRLQDELLKKTPDNAELMYDQAMLAEKAGDRVNMERLLRRIIISKPDFFHAYNALGYTFADRGENLAEARQLIETALRLAPGDPLVTDSLGWLEYRSGNLSRARELLAEAYGKRKDAEIAVHYGEVLWVSGDQASARAVWAEAKKIDSENAALRATLKRLGVSL